jgi:prepilin-type N-terminal cleavage/methylation domain-containing protein
MRRPGFSILELALVMAVITVIAAFSIPMYREFQIRSDLDTTAMQVSEAIGRAKQLSLSGQGDSGWGFYVPAGVLYKGKSYAARDPSRDETYPFPKTIAPSGLLEVAFSKLEGRPTATGTVLLTAINGDQRSISIAILERSLPTTQDDHLTICHCNAHSGSTKKIPDSAWPGHLKHGDHLGACTGKVNECK